MTRRAMTAAVALFASSASAQAISGTLSASFVGFNEFGGATTRVNLQLSCALTCPPSAPELSYSAADAAGYFVVEPAQKAGSLSYSFISGVGMTGTSTTDTTNFSAGSNFFVKATSVSCRCGNRTGEGGYIELRSAAVSIPPWITVPAAPYNLGEFLLLAVSATPRLGETVDVSVRGAGIDFTSSFPASDFVSTSSTPSAALKQLNVTPTQPGTVTVTAAVTGGPTSTKTFEVLAGGAGGGSGGGGSSSGGGAGGGQQPAGGCTTVPSLLPLSAMLWLALRRRTLRQ